MIHDALQSLIESRSLSRQEAETAMEALMSGQTTPAQAGAFLALLACKGPAVDEVIGFATVMRDKAARVPASRRPLVDTCGTGGDHSGTFNISTTAAFVVAGADVAVAKHGNRSATSRCGSADVLEALGVNLEASPERVAQCIDDVGIGFLYARTMHAAMKHVAPVRSELKVRTVFNILGPLTNPARACGQVVGVYDKGLVVALANVLGGLGSRRAFVAAGSDGLDEITTAGPTFIAESRGLDVCAYEIEPLEFGLQRPGEGALKGGDADKNASILRAVLNGEPGPPRDIVLLNAAAALLAGDACEDWAAGLERAAASIDSGAARKKLDDLIDATNDS